MVGCLPATLRCPPAWPPACFPACLPDPRPLRHPHATTPSSSPHLPAPSPPRPSPADAPAPPSSTRPWPSWASCSCGSAAPWPPSSPASPPHRGPTLRRPLPEVHPAAPLSSWACPGRICSVLLHGWGGWGGIRTGGRAWARHRCLLNSRPLPPPPAPCSRGRAAALAALAGRHPSGQPLPRRVRLVLCPA